jgi:hypothetical protein
MATEVQMGGAEGDRIFLDTDFRREWHVKDYDTDSTGATAKDMTGKTCVFDIRRENKSSAALLSATLSVVGSFNSVAASNTQRLRWVCADTDITTTIFGADGGTFRYSVKDTTAGAETVLQTGDIVIERATQV